MITKASHTPVPWIAHYKTVCRAGSVKPVAVCQIHEDAELIVRAVNHHERVVATLKTLREDLLDRYDGATDSTTKWLEELVQSLETILAELESRA